MKISACVIVKNEEKNLPQWLGSMSHIADEMIVVDTGSTDSSVQLAKKAGAKVYEFPWVNDFSAAKNYAIEQAHGDWIVFLDADEYFDNNTLNSFRQTMEIFNRKSKVGCIMCRLTNIDRDNNDKIINTMLQVRIFRNLKQIRYENKIHEHLVNHASNLSMVFSKNISILHTGYSASILRLKAKRNLKLMLEQYEQADEYQKGIITGNLMDAYNSLGEYDKAIECAEKCIELGFRQVGQDGHFYEILISAMLSAKKPIDDVYQALDNAMDANPDDPVFSMEKGYLLQQNRNYLEAELMLKNGFHLRQQQEEKMSKGIGLTDNSIRMLPFACEAMGNIYWIKGNKKLAADYFSKGLGYYAYNPGLLKGLYKCIAESDIIEIIQCLNCYYKKDKDGEFILNTLAGTIPKELVAYYSSDKKKLDEEIKYISMGRYDGAAVISSNKLEELYQMAVASVLADNTVQNNYLQALIPPVYDDILKNNDAIEGIALKSRERRAVERLVKNIRKHNNQPLVSIMIPTYNRPELFEKTLLSAMKQTYPNIEILVNDNSTDDRTEMLMDKYLSDDRIRYFRNKNAKTKPENFAPFEFQAKGELLQWCMDDDILLPDKLTNMVSILVQNSTVTLVTSMRGIIDGNDNIQSCHYSGILSFDEELKGFSGEFIGRLILTTISNFIGEPSAVLFRRKDLTHHYWQAESKGLYAISDVAMWLELMEKGNCVIFREPFSYYRRHGQQEGQRPDVVLLSRLEWIKLIEEYHGKGVFLKTEEEYKTGLRKLYQEYLDSFTKIPELQNQPHTEEYIKAMNNIGGLLR